MATTEPTAPLPETAPAPEVGTPDAATPTAAEATHPSPTPTVDWENRYKAAQAELTRQQMARAAAERERDALRMQQQVEPEDEDEGIPTPARPARRTPDQTSEWQKRALEAEWQIARSVHGEDVIAAYSGASELLKSATTPADYVNAFESYHMARSKGMTHQEAVAQSTPAPEPVRVDSNRSDAPPLPDDEKLREAAEKKDMTGWIAARLRSAGL